jgi:cytochrome c peroxidase
MKNCLFFLLLLTIATSFQSCNPPVNPPIDFKATPYNFDVPPYFPKHLNIEKDDSLTVEGVELGRYLFYDGRLRGYAGNDPDSLMSCATCHVQQYSFKCGIDNPRFPEGKTTGVTGIPTPHNMMPLSNLIFNHNGYFWNGTIHKSNPNSRQRTLEDVVYMGVVAPHEMNSTMERCVNTIASIGMYPPKFKAAFGTEDVTAERIQKAIGQFIRSLVSYNSKFDKYIRKEVQLSPEELQGYILFITEEGADCFHCHGGDGNLLMTTNLFYNNGLDTIFTDIRDRFSVTFNPNDKGAYRVPSLRNIEVTAPYMHDGRFKTLDEVIDFYSEGVKYSPYINPLMHKVSQGGAMLTPLQKRQLKAFLRTLTDEDFLTNPKFSKPKDLP